MDVINQVLFLIFIASFTNSKLENADLQTIASQLKVTHYGCGEMTKINLYALNRVPDATLLPRKEKLAEQKLRCTQNIFDKKSTQQFVESNTRVNNGTVALETIQAWTSIIQEE